MELDIIINDLIKLKFDGRGESYVEQVFLMPFLKALGYENHKDYEVKVHGDEGTSFKLHYPPVELGAKKVKHYNPDYIPTIRKKSFWVIEAKSAKDVKFPLDYSFIVQGLQYCIHPEIRARLLVISNGKQTAIYNAFNLYFDEESLYSPILEFSNCEIKEKWKEIYGLLSIERMRAHLEEDLKDQYEKLAGSSLDKKYPDILINKISKNKSTISNSIRKHVSKLNLEAINNERDRRLEYLYSLSYQDLYKYLDLPLPGGKCEAEIYVEKASQYLTIEEIYQKLNGEYNNASIFLKEQIYCAMCKLYLIANEDEKVKIEVFLKQKQTEKLPIQHKVECLLLRINRKVFTIYFYPNLRKNIEEKLRDAPEITKYVYPPSVLDYTFEKEIQLHHETWLNTKDLEIEKITELIKLLEDIEVKIEDDFKEAEKKLTDKEKLIGGFETYRENRTIFTFKNIQNHYGIVFNENKQM